MKRLIALLILLSLCFSSCSVFEGIIGNKEPASGLTDGCKAGSHTDDNDDGSCDYCAISVLVFVDLFAVNDLHGKINATSSQPGIGGLTKYLKTVSNENSVLLSSGDMWQGSSESNLTYGAFITEWMNELGFVSMTIGNHEYDWTEKYIRDNAALAEFPMLAINVYDTKTGKRAEYATPSIVIERGGIEIGIIGAIGDCHSSISGDVNDGFTFKVGSELTSLVKAEATRLRNEGVDFIVYSLHDGYENSSSGTKLVQSKDIAYYYDTSLSNGYVDLVFEGHTHQSYVLSDSYGVYHLQGGGENKGISHAQVAVNSVTGTTNVRTAEIVKSSVYSKLSADPLVAELLEKYDDVISSAYEVLGTNRQYRDDSVVEQIVADLYYEFGVETWGDEYDIALGGGFVRTRNPYNLAAGQITYSDIYSLLPFDNNIVLCSISGSDLLSKFINSTNEDYYISSGVDINTLRNSIEPGKTYYIVTDTYTSTYAYNRCTEVARITDHVFARDLFAEYVRNGGLS